MLELKIINSIYWFLFFLHLFSYLELRIRINVISIVYYYILYDKLLIKKKFTVILQSMEVWHVSWLCNTENVVKDSRTDNIL